MSASEKLQALNDATPLEKYEIDLFSFLPQMVSVVEAAERLRWLTDPEGAIGEGRGFDIRAAAIQTRRALAALDEKLG